MTTAMRPVDVIVPVYNAPQAVERCLESVLANTPEAPDIRIVVADDASPDPRVAAVLEKVGTAHRRLVIERRPVNLGFPGNCNESMAKAAGDVVLLNSDTVVPEGWLEPLRRLAHSSERVGSITPLTSNGEINSVPVWLQVNRYPSGFDVDDLNDIARTVGYGDWIEVPTGIGFCQYFTRTGLDAVGLFDAEAFGRGYGEENDLCLRLRHNGFVNLLCDTVFVHHEGGLSFGQSTPDRLKENLAFLNRRWPGYGALIADFIDQNPLAGIQGRFGLELLRRSVDPARLRVLQVLHNPIRSGHIGGTEFHVDDLVTASDNEHVVLSAVDGNPVIQHRDIADFQPFPVAHQNADGQPWVGPLLGVGIDVVHIHHLAGLGFDRMSALLEEAARRNIPVVYSTHDYYALCPGIQLRDSGSGRPCQADLGGDCAGCDEKAVALTGGGRDRWRHQWGRLLSQLTVVSPSQAAADHHRAVWDSIHDLEIIPHGMDRPPIGQPVPPPHDRPRLAVIGYGGSHKGDHELNAIVAALRGQGIQCHFFGREAPVDAVDDDLLVYHGRYDRKQIVGLLEENALTAALSLPNWPETFSYTLSEAWLAGLFVFASNQGAIAERIGLTGAGIVFPSRHPDERAELIVNTLQSPATVSRLREAARQAGRDHLTVRQMTERYDSLYRRLVRGQGRPSDPTLVYRWTAHEKSSLVGLFRSPLPVGV